MKNNTFVLNCYIFFSFFNPSREEKIEKNRKNNNINVHRLLFFVLLKYDLMVLDLSNKIN